MASIMATSTMACSGDDEAAFVCTILPVCDIRQLECQAHVYQASACAREQEAGSIPAIRTITGSEFEAELRAELAEDPNSVPVAWETAYQLLGLVPSRPLADVLIESTVSNAAAFYDPRTKLVTVIEDNTLDPEAAAWILSHEFVHALQDQDVDLTAFDARWTQSTDDSMAITALIEGEAMLHPNVLQVRRLGRRPENVDWDRYSSDVLQSVLETVEVAPSPFVDAVGTLPYPIGLRFLIGPWLSGGQAAIDALFETPHFPFADWVAAFAGGTPETDPLECFPTGAPPGFTAFDHDSLGPTGLLGLHVALGASGAGAFSLSQHLHDDSFVVFTNAAGSGFPSGGCGLATAFRRRCRRNHAGSTPWQPRAPARS